MTWDFCVNVLAGVVASTIFIKDNELLEGRTFLCVVVIIVLKTITARISRRRLEKSFQEFLANPRPAPAIPTGAR
jgi:hypothetical protein